MNIDDKIRALMDRRGMTPAQLGRAACLSRPTMSRVMHGHIPSDENLNRISIVLEVSPGYLRGGYVMPEHLTEDDILFFADLRNIPYLKLVKEAAEKGLTPEDFKNIVDIIEKIPG